MDTKLYLELVGGNGVVTLIPVFLPRLQAVGVSFGFTGGGGVGGLRFVDMMDLVGGFIHSNLW